MTTLAASFLEDLDELGENSEEEYEMENEPTTLNESSLDDAIPKKENFGLEEGSEERMNSMKMLVENVRNQDVEDITSLRKSETYRSHMSDIELALGKSVAMESSVLLEDDPEYQLIVVSNDLAQKIDDEIFIIHKYVAEIYSKKLPELESLVPNALDYLRVAKCIGNVMDLTLVDLTLLLPSATIMGLSVTGSTTSGQPLSEMDLQRVIQGCDEGLGLHADKNKIIQFVESRMNFLAPNVSAIVGTRITAQLMSLAGSILQLSRIVACNIQVLGQQKKTLSGYSTAAALMHTGIIYFCDLIQNTPPDLRRRACRAVAGKVALCARVDSEQRDKNGNIGMQYRRELEDKIEKWQEPQKAKTKKALPIPDEKPRRKRGGKRYRKMKERFAMTDVRKEANRQSFARADDEYGDDAMGVSYGRLGQAGSGNLRVIRKEQKQKVKKLKAATFGGTSGATCGLASSLAFTPVQGIELMNPNAAEERVRQANKKYFASSGQFTKK